MLQLTSQKEEAPKQAHVVASMASQPGWAQVLKPHLESKIQHLWLDPREVSDKETFWYRYVTAWGFSQAAREILRLVEGYVQQAETLEKKRKGELKDKFQIGGD